MFKCNNFNVANSKLAIVTDKRSLTIKTNKIMNAENIRTWINIIRTDINMMAGNVDNKDRFEEMRNNALTNLSYLEQRLTSD